MPGEKVGRQRKAGSWLKLLAPVLAALIGLVALKILMPQMVNQQQLSGWLRHLGGLAPVAFILLLTVRPLLLLPGQLLTAVGGMLFGTLWGGIYAMIGSFLSCVVVYLLANRLGKRLMKKLAGSKYPALVQATKNHDFQLAMLGTINPLIPTDVMVAAAAAARARFWPTLLGVLVGTLPGTFLTAQFGSALGQGKTIMTTLSGVGLMVSLVLGLLLWRKVFHEIADAPGEPERAGPEVSGGLAPKPPLPPRHPRNVIPFSAYRPELP